MGRVGQTPFVEKMVGVRVDPVVVVVAAAAVVEYIHLVFVDSLPSQLYSLPQSHTPRQMEVSIKF